MAADPKRTAAVTSAPVRELLSFRVGAQEFCIDIAAVREIRGWSPTTPLPRAPAHLRGVLNLRGAALPILDLAERLGFGAVAEPTPQNVVVIVEAAGRTVGLLVSSVCGIFTAEASAIQPTPDLGSSSIRSHLHGLLTVEDRMVGVLRVDQLIGLPELA